MIRHLPNTLLDRSGLVSRADLFLPSHLVLWVSSADTVRELIRSAAGFEVVEVEELESVNEGEQRLWVRRKHGSWVGIVLKETDE